jgi:hypothetical protein
LRPFVVATERERREDLAADDAGTDAVPGPTDAIVDVGVLIQLAEDREAV